jgi:uncharacterized damage-inducible protein DinB
MVEPAALAAHLRYSAWASKLLLDFARTLPEADLTKPIPNSHGGILKTFQHIYYADREWLARMEGSPPEPFEDPEPGPSLAELETAWPPLLDRLRRWASGERDPNRISEDEDGAAPVYQVVLHLVNHGTYHRGQIAAMLRMDGHVPPSTDLIYFLEHLRTL